MKKLSFLLVLFITTAANAIEVGESLPTFAIIDQFDKKHSLAAQTKTIIVTSSKKSSKIVREYLLTQHKDFLRKNSAYFIADISGMPGFIAKLFAIPKMKECTFPILLIDKEQARIFDTEDEQITVYHIENGKVLSVEYMTGKEELANLFR